MYTWGKGYCGALGHGDEIDKTTPELLTNLRECRAVQVSYWDILFGIVAYEALFFSNLNYNKTFFCTYSNNLFSKHGFGHISWLLAAWEFPVLPRAHFSFILVVESSLIFELVKFWYRISFLTFARWTEPFLVIVLRISRCWLKVFSFFYFRFLL